MSDLEEQQTLNAIRIAQCALRTPPEISNAAREWILAADRHRVMAAAIRLLDSADADDREGAVELLGKLGSQANIPDLLPLISDDVMFVRQDALWAIQDIAAICFLDNAMPEVLNLVEPDPRKWKHAEEALTRWWLDFARISAPPE